VAPNKIFVFGRSEPQTLRYAVPHISLGFVLWLYKMSGKLCSYMNVFSKVLTYFSGVTVLGGPWPLLFIIFSTERFLWGGVSSPTFNPDLEIQGVPFCLGHHL
jgi:hypothetical protein